MSGDMQPRKRKDKRRKKEGSSLGNIHEPLGAQPRFRGKSFDEDRDASPVFGSVDQGEKIHVHNDHGIGGNICVKIIFFCLFGALVTAVAIIFIHSRGSTDVDLPSIEESRFAEYFTGWLDDAPDDHGHDEHEVLHHEDDKLDEEEDEHGGGDDHAEEHEEEEHEEDEAGEAVREVEEEEKEEYSPEADENEEDDKADDSKENEDEDDDDKDVEDKDADDDNGAPKFKIVHRFKHFFNKRKQFARDKSEDVKVVKKWSDLRRTRRLRVDRTSENEVEESETEEDDDEIDEDEEDEIKKEERSTESKEKIYAEDKEKAEEEEEEEVNEEVEQLGSEEEEEENEEESEEYKEKDGVETEEDESEEIDNEDEVEQPEKNEEQLNDEIKEPNFGYNEDEDEDEKDKIGLDEIDESEEALKEEERLTEEVDEEPEEDDNEAEDESAADEVYEVKRKKRKDDVKDEEIVEVESKIMDIEEKLNKILREKRKIVEKRKMELEEIEIASLANEKEEQPEKEEDEEESSSNGVAIKVLVGIALIIVAHMVLVQKWNAMDNVPVDEKSEGQTEGDRKDSEEESYDVEPVISRRQTLVPETSNLNEYFADEIEEEEEQEEKDDEEEEEDQDEEIEEECVSEDYSEEEVLVRENRPWSVEHPNRVANLSSEDEDGFSEEEGVEDEEDLDEEIEDEEIEEEEEEEEEEDDYDWKRLESVRREEPVEVEEDIPPIPPPRRSHMHSGERRGGPQGMDDFTYDTFEELWENVDSIGQDEHEGEQTPEQEEKESVTADEMENDLFKEDYKFAEDQIDNNPIASLKKYDAILSKKQDDIRALIGRAKALDKVAEKEKSNQFLKEAINNYKFVLTTHAHSLHDEQFLEISERCIERMRFGGYFKSAVDIHKALIKKFPATPKYRNDLAVTYLFLNDIPSARSTLNDTLKMWPKNGFALVHYGFILKTVDNKHAEAANMIIAGIKTREPGVIDGRFFFHLGDALNRIGRRKEAMEWYDEGVKEGLFLSKYQRSLYNVNRLKGQPWWTHDETTYQDFFQKLEKHWQKIRDEGLALLNGKGVNLFKQEAENLKDTGDWRQLDLYFRGRRHSNCDRAPFTCSLIGSFHPASTCTRGQVKFSVMLPSTHVWPHCGPTNCRLRSHLGLVVPKNTFLRVAEETRSWEEGKVIVFDDSFEHEVWHNGTSVRLVLIVDVWHPDLTLQERKYLSPI